MKQGKDGVRCDFIGDLTRFGNINVKNVDKGISFSKDEIERIQNKLYDEIWKEKIGYCPCPDALSAAPLGEWWDNNEKLVALAHKDERLQLDAMDRKKKILVILESPHIYEYQKVDDGVPCPAPARDVTGTGGAIKRYMPIMFDRNFDEYYIALINAVQFQCSLGLPLGGKKMSQIEFLRIRFSGGVFPRKHIRIVCAIE